MHVPFTICDGEFQSVGLFVLLMRRQIRIDRFIKMTVEQTPDKDVVFDFSANSKHNHLLSNDSSNKNATKTLRLKILHQFISMHRMLQTVKSHPNIKENLLKNSRATNQ